jgi:hypothetical protein
VTPTLSGTGFQPGRSIDVFVSAGNSNFTEVASNISVSADGTFSATIDLFNIIDCGTSEQQLDIHAVATPKSGDTIPATTVASTTYTVVP